MKGQFKRSLSAVDNWRLTAKLKTSLKVKVKISLCNGGCPTWFDSAEAIVIRRVDIQRVHDYARIHCDLRDYLLIRLPMKIGLRTGEIATLSIEDIDFDSRSFQVLDSKQRKFYPLPLDMLTLQLIQDLIGELSQGLVFTHKTHTRTKKDQPLSTVALWKTVRNIGREAGVKHFYPRLLRHYFAADWHIVQHKSIETLRRILRHKNLAVTHKYLARLVFFEDVQREYDNVKNPYFAEPRPSESQSDFGEKFCSTCEHEPTCKFKSVMCSCPAITSCRYYVKKEELKKVEVRTDESSVKQS